MPIQTILAHAMWTNCQTFAKFYKRKIVDDKDLGQAILEGFVSSDRSNKN